MASSNSAAHAPHDELEPATVQRAWVLLRQPSWPPTWEATQDDARLSRLVLTYARQLQRSEARRAAANDWTPLLAPTAAPKRSHEVRYHCAPVAAGVVDRKRAAAGDRDDD